MKSFLVVLLLALIPACTFAYIPLVPEAQEWEPLLDLRGSAGLAVGDEGLALHLRLSEVPQAGWLALQWFGPGRSQASSSLWVEPALAGEERTVFLPESLRLTPGAWRVVVSFGGVVARQFSLSVD